MEKSQQMASRSYSPGVITDGGRVVWLAGQTGFRDEQGKEVVGFEAQARQAFHAIDARAQEGRRQRCQYGDDDGVHWRRPLTVSNFARPGMLIEIQGVAVIGG